MKEYCNLCGENNPSKLVIQKDYTYSTICVECSKRIEAEKKQYRLYFSERGLPLVYCGPPLEHPIVTIENYCKWYHLYLVMPDGSVKIYEPKKENLQKYEDEIEGKYYCDDHNFNVEIVEQVADEEHIFSDDQSMEMIIGRYERERRDNWQVNRKCWWLKKED